MTDSMLNIFHAVAEVTSSTRLEMKVQFPKMCSQEKEKTMALVLGPWVMFFPLFLFFSFGPLVSGPHCDRPSGWSLASGC